MSAWIETRVSSRLVLERRAKDLKRMVAESTGEEGGWLGVYVYAPRVSIEQARNDPRPEDDEYDYRLVWERTETRREDVSE